MGSFFEEIAGYAVPRTLDAIIRLNRTIMLENIYNNRKYYDILIQKNNSWYVECGILECGQS